MALGDARPGPTPGGRPATILESVDDLRAALLRPRTLRESIPAAVAPAPAAPAAGDETLPFRPTHRPPMALLSVVDDGEDDAELHRVRGHTFVIGRVEGDLVIPHDAGLSGRHAEISRRLVDGQWRWFLKDLQSTNGTFVRASSAVLSPGQEILIGGRRYRFEAARPASTAPASAPGAVAATHKWQAIEPEEAVAAASPALVELTPQGEAARFRLVEPSYWVGRDPSQCTIVLPDPMVSPRHARVLRDGRGRWVIQNAKSLNGIWVRLGEVPLERGGQFQCGEQRFAIRIL